MSAAFGVNSRPAPRTRRGLQRSRQLALAESACADALAALDCWSNGVLLLDRTGRVALMNAAARRAFERPIGLALAGGYLRAKRADDNAALQRLLSAAPRRKRRPSSLSITIGSVERLLIEVVAHLPREAPDLFAETDIERIVFIRTVVSRSADYATALGTRFGLTPTETKVAEHVTCGAQIRDIAVRLGVTKNTVRTHVRQLLRKSGTESVAAFAAAALFSIDGSE